MALNIIYETENNTLIGVIKGGKSLYNFKVRYKEKNKQWRTPKHIHIIIDLYMKLVGNEELTMRLVDHFINNVVKKIKPSQKYPPDLQIFKIEHVLEFSDLNRYGEYPVDFLLVTNELIQIQEKTNYPDGKLNLNLLELFRKKADIFSVVSAATFGKKR